MDNVVLKWHYKGTEQGCNYQMTNYTGVMTFSRGGFSLRLWPLPALFTMYLGIVYFCRAYRRIRRRREGRCLSCGYDLTGNVSGVCPECGTAIAKHE
jgi:hypothetical protein